MADLVATTVEVVSEFGADGTQGPEAGKLSELVG
jgi:hypothetical protein